MKAAKIVQKALCFCGLVSMVSLSILVSLLFVSSFPSYAQGIQDNDPHTTGLILPTTKEIAAFKKTHGKVVKVRPNTIALERANKERGKKGLLPLSEAGTVPFGKEIISSAEDAMPDTKDIVTQEISSTDNSTFPAFPVIRSQGSLGSCASFAITYYHLTYTAGQMYGWDNKNEDNTTKFSPRWTYNFVNRGENNGSSFFSNYDVLEEHGSATWAEFEYDGSDYLQWCLDTQTWENAIQYRINPVVYVDVDENSPDTAITQIKQILANANIVTFGTYISSWQYMRIRDNRNSTDDDPYVRKDIAYWVNGQLGGHAMTIVGYNDSIWADINDNRKIDDGELGAFRIANSWGSNWKDGGFTWLSYDAFRATSAVSGAPIAGRVGAIVTGMVFEISLKYQYPSNTPKVIAVFEVSHTRRNQLRISLGISDTQPTVPEVTWYPGAINLQGGPYDFNGDTIGCNGVFVFDFTDILPTETELKNYYLGVYDSVADGYQAKLFSYKIIDLENNAEEWTSTTLPITFDDGQHYALIDYMYTSSVTNNPPIAVASAEPLSGPVPLTVEFDGSGSYDAEDGYNLAKYFWNFGNRVSPPGDKSGVSGQIVTHTFYEAGAFSAKLTVTDSGGTTSSTALTITAEPGSNFMHISSIVMTVTTRGKNKYAEADVYIFNSYNKPLSGATVTGSWSGLTGNTNTGVTNSQGMVTLSSDKVDKSASGTFTFCVDGVSLDGYIYDPAMNEESCDSIPTP